MDCSGPKNLELKCMQNEMVWYPYESVMLVQKSEVDDFGSLLYYLLLIGTQTSKL